MQQRMIRDGEVTLATQAFGSAAAPPVLLVMGAMASMLWWPEGFVQALANHGRYVIRYDNRDTGLSTSWPPGAPDYTLADMAADAVRVLDGYGLGRAHLVGMSLGGVIAQRVALGWPERVATLVAISSSPAGITGLPPMTEAYGAHAAASAALDWSDQASVLDFMARDARLLAGSGHPHDAAAARALVERDLARSTSFASATNHILLEGGSGRGGDGPTARDIAVPTLVIHGTDDPIFPIEHGEALAAVVPGARLLRLAGGGHELHEADWPQIVEAIAEHTARG